MLTPEFHIYITLGILLVAVLAYAQERVPMVLVSLGLLVLVVVVFQIYPFTDLETGVNLLSAEELLTGFSHPALVIVVALLVIGEGVTVTGAVSAVASWIQQLSLGNWRVALTVSLLFVAVASAFLNNTPIVVIFLPIMISLADELNISSSKFLMQLSFVSILGGTCTLMGTSTNILVTSIAEQAGAGEFGMFTFTGLGAIVLLVGTIYLVFVAPYILPANSPVGGQEAQRQFLANLEILPETMLDCRAMLDEEVKELFENISIKRIVRDGRVLTLDRSQLSLQAGDSLLIAGSARELKKLEWDSGSTLRPTSVGQRRSKDARQQSLAEIVVMPGTSLVGRILSQLRFQNCHGVSVIGIQQHRHMQVRNLSKIKLRAGDVLLVQGAAGQLNCLASPLGGQGHHRTPRKGQSRHLDPLVRRHSGCDPYRGHVGGINGWRLHDAIDQMPDPAAGL